MNSDVNQIATEIIGQLERAWNSADGQAFGLPFTEDADFVNIRGDHFHTQEVIAQAHQYIFDTMYEDSVSRLELMQARSIDDEVFIAQMKATVNTPTGPLAGEGRAVATLVIVSTESGWRIAAFHNTAVNIDIVRNRP